MLLAMSGDGGHREITEHLGVSDNRVHEIAAAGNHPPSVGWDYVGCVARPGDAPTG
jgi:hypothetical protein